MSKLEKLRQELEHARARRVALDAKIKDLEQKCRAEENAQIHGMVHAANLTPEQLAVLLAQVKRSGLVPMPETEQNEKTEEEYDENR